MNINERDLQKLMIEILCRENQVAFKTLNIPIVLILNHYYYLIIN